MAAPDKGTRWLIRNCTGSLLHRLRGRRVLRWEAPKPGLLHLERTPDGLLQALFEGETEPRPVLVEVITYPKTDLARQCVEDVCLTRVAHRQVPDVVVVLCRGNVLVTLNRATETSADGATTLTVEWTVIYAWEYTADELLRDENPEEAPGRSWRTTARPPRKSWYAAPGRSSNATRTKHSSRNCWPRRRRCCG